MFEKRANDRRSIASTTKLMTALLALERARPNEVFTAPRYDALPIESQINLRTGERMKVKDLLKALLLESANDAAATLARNISGSQQAFVAAMNARAEELGLEDTSYANPIGLDDPANFSSARDLAGLARLLLSRPRFARIVEHAGGGARVRCGAARDRQPQPVGVQHSVGVRGEDRLHGERRLRPGRLGHRAGRRQGDQRGARRAERGGP